MNGRFNPYYSPDKLGLESISFDEPDLSYEYNTFLFVKTPDGRVYCASDSGCSCPTPFENYEGEEMEEVVNMMERVEDYSMGEGFLRSWGKSHDGKSWLDSGDFHSLKTWWPA